MEFLADQFVYFKVTFSGHVEGDIDMAVSLPSFFPSLFYFCIHSCALRLLLSKCFFAHFYETVRMPFVMWELVYCSANPRRHAMKLTRVRWTESFPQWSHATGSVRSVPGYRPLSLLLWLLCWREKIRKQSSSLSKEAATQWEGMSELGYWYCDGVPLPRKTIAKWRSCFVKVYASHVASTCTLKRRQMHVRGLAHVNDEAHGAYHHKWMLCREYAIRCY